MDTYVIRKDERQLVRDGIEVKDQRRCGEVNIEDKVFGARMRWYGQVIRTDEGQLVRKLWNSKIRKDVGR